MNNTAKNNETSLVDIPAFRRLLSVVMQKWQVSVHAVPNNKWIIQSIHNSQQNIIT